MAPGSVCLIRRSPRHPGCFFVWLALVWCGAWWLVGCDASPAEVSRASQVEVVRFVAEPSSVVAGEQVRLRWEMAGVERATIRSGEGIIARRLSGEELRGGELLLRPVESARYTLVAEGHGASREAAVDVSVSAPVGRPSAALRAEPTQVRLGESVRLTWSSERASGVRLEANGAPLELGSASASGGEVVLHPTADTRYVLVATGPGGQVQAQAAVEVLAPPEVTRFGVDASSLAEGEGTVLRWEVLGAESVSLLAGSAPLSLEGLSPERGEVAISPSETTVYTLVARNADGESRASLEVSVRSRPQILALTADPGQVRPGEAARVAWAVSGAERVRLWAGSEEIALPAGAEAGGAVLVRPPVTTRYTLRAESAGGIVESTCDVEVYDRTLIRVFRAEPPRIGVGEGATLRWETSGATSVVLTGPDGLALPVDPGALDGAWQVYPGQTSRYRLEASGPAGVALADVQVVVDPAPGVLSFTATPEAVAVGGEVMLAWQAVNVEGVSLEAEPGGEVPLSGVSGRAGAVVVRPEETTTYRLRVWGARGEASSQVVVPVFREVGIARFEASQVIVDRGEPARLSWATLNAATVTLRWSAGGEEVSREVPAEGELEVSGLEETTRFVLQADGIGGPVEASVRVEVGVAPRVLGFTLEPERAAAGTPRALRWWAEGATRATILVSEEGGAEVPLTEGALDVSGGVWEVSPQVETRYRLVLGNGSGVVGAEVSAEVVAATPPEAIWISELGGLEGGALWVEVVNTGSGEVDVSGVGLGAWIGGELAGWWPLGGEALGVGAALLVQPSSPEVAAALGEGEVTFGLSRAGEGASGRWSAVTPEAAVVARLRQGGSWQRLPGATATGWVVSAHPTPLRGASILDAAPWSPGGAGRDPRVVSGRLSGPEDGGEVIGLRAWLPGGALEGAWLGGQAASCEVSEEALVCVVPPGRGVADLVLQVPGGTVEASGLYAYEEALGCGLVGPLALGVGLGERGVAGEVWGFTGWASGGEPLEAAWGWGPPGSDPLYAASGWSWYPAEVSAPDATGERGLLASAPLPLAEASFVFRVRPLGASVWTYCDSDGTYNAAAPPRNLFEPDAAGLLDTLR